jgi:hypothetical protein
METVMPPQRTRVIREMIVAALSLATRMICIQALRRLIVYYRHLPDPLSEDEVRGYLLDLRGRSVTHCGAAGRLSTTGPMAGAAHADDHERG